MRLAAGDIPGLPGLPGFRFRGDLLRAMRMSSYGNEYTAEYKAELRSWTIPKLRSSAAHAVGVLCSEEGPVRVTGGSTHLRPLILCWHCCHKVAGFKCPAVFPDDFAQWAGNFATGYNGRCVTRLSQQIYIRITYFVTRCNPLHDDDYYSYI